MHRPETTVWWRGLSWKRSVALKGTFIKSVKLLYFIDGSSDLKKSDRSLFLSCSCAARRFFFLWLNGRLSDALVRQFYGSKHREIWAIGINYTRLKEKYWKLEKNVRKKCKYWVFYVSFTVKKLKCLIHSLTNTNCDRYISQFFNVEFNLKTDFFFCMRKKN